MRPRRRPIIGLVGGLVLGVGVALILVFTSLAILGTYTVIFITIVGGALGLIWAYMAPPRRVPPA